MFPYIGNRQVCEIEFRVQNGNWGGLNHSTVFVDDIQFLPPGTGEGNGNQFANLQLTTQSWYPAQNWFQVSAANKRVRPGGVLLAQLWANGGGAPILNGTVPFVVMVDVVSYGTNQSFPLPGEPSAIGLSAGMSVGLLGNWGYNVPPLPVSVAPSALVFLPPTLPFDGIYLQAGILDASAPNGVRISNMVRHRFE